MTVEYPLQWPDHIERSKGRETGKFKTSLAGAKKNVLDSLRRFAVDSGKKIENPVISSNVTLSTENPSDPGVAVWFVWDGIQVSIPVDRYSSVAANLQAIHHVIEARRTELRHGTLALVRATFKGFQALPSPGKTSKRPWWVVFDLPENCTKAEAQNAYREKAKTAHPDRGGSQSAMAELNIARDEARRHFAGE
jgi:hypothetical protein